MPIATLSIDLQARLAALEAGFDKASRLAEKTASLIETRFVGSGIVASRGLQQAFAGISVAALTRGLLNGVDALNDFADATGASIENASALDDVARRTGTSLENVEGILVKFNSVLKEADGKNGASLVLQRLGLEADKLRKLDPAEALRQVAVALSKFANDGERARYTQELFGKSVRDAAPFLKDLAEQQRLNATVTTEQAEAVEKFNKQMFALQTNVVEVARKVSGPLITALNELYDKFKQFDGVKGFLKADLGLDELGQLKTKAQDLDADIKRTTDTIERMTEALRRDPGNSMLEGRIEKARARLAGLQGQAAATAEELKRVANRMAPPEPFEANFPLSDPRKLPPLPTDTDKPKKTKRDFVGPEVPQSLKDALDRIERTDVAKVARLREELDRLTEIRRAGNSTPEVAEAIQEIERELLKLDPATEAAAQRMERLNKLLAATPTAQLEDARRDMELLVDALERGEISQEQFLEAAAQRLDLVAEKTEKAKGLSEELGLTFTSAFEDAAVKGGDMRDVLKGIEQDLLRIFTRKYATKPLADAFGNLLDSAGGAGGFLESLNLGALFGVTFAKGGAFGPSGVIPFADGGVVTRPTLFKFAKGTGLMGEAGPEAILPLVRGKGGKLGVQASGQGGGGPQIVLQPTYHIGQGVSRAEVFHAVRLGNAQLLQQLRSARDRGGEF